MNKNRSLWETVLKIWNGIRIPISTKLILSFLLIIVLISAVFTEFGIRLISDRIVAEAQEKVGLDLNAAREIYRSRLTHVNDVVRLTASRFFITDALLAGAAADTVTELQRVKTTEDLDFLNIVDKGGMVLVRANKPERIGDGQIHNELVSTVLSEKTPVAATMIITADDLKLESTQLAEQAHFDFIDTPMARTIGITQQSDGMALMAAAPIFDYQNRLIGVLYGGVLLNRNHEIVDEVKQTVYQDMKYKDKEIGTATIFQDDVRISTNVKNEDGTRATATRVSESVYQQVVLKGKPYIGRAYVVNDWYITAYEPIRDIHNRVIGILYVGVLEQKYTDIREQVVVSFVSIAAASSIVAMLFAYFISRRISVPLGRLVAASQRIAGGDLEAKVDIKSNDELGKLAYTFNGMANALKTRDIRMKEFAKKKISESERLALVGQLSANVAHELNNPLQGIVTYASLALERQAFDEKTKNNIQKIVIQANRCRDIIRGLLDFSRHKNPDKALTSVNNLLKGCISLVENQAVFHNIEIVTNFDPALPMVILDPSQVERVFLNLIINAAEAMEGTGKLTVTTMMNGKKRCIEVDVADTGPGIADGNLEKIFDPFFTTKETGHGVGLGLAISHGIVAEHGGALTVETKLGKGTTFTVTLPLPKIETGTSNG